MKDALFSRPVYPVEDYERDLAEYKLAKFDLHTPPARCQGCAVVRLVVLSAVATGIVGGLIVWSM